MMNLRKSFLERFTLITLLGWMTGSVSGQNLSLPLELAPTNTTYNVVSMAGLPISSQKGNPPGSNGLAPGPESGPPPTPGQYQGLALLGGVLTGEASIADGSRTFNLTRARVGNFLVGQAFSYSFGDVIPVPSVDEFGVSLAVTNSTDFNPARSPTTPELYWKAEPFTTTGHTQGGYYWSRHAEKVFATEPGQSELVWRKAIPEPEGSSASYPQDTGVVTLGGFSYLVVTNRPVVASSFGKAPRKMYWTEGPFTQVGKPISVPTDRVQSIQVVFNSAFPSQVSEEVLFDGKTATTLQITNTVWFDRSLNLLRAYNREGRVFIELLGDKRGQFAGQDVHVHLGYELLEVIQRPRTEDVMVELGERLTPYQEEEPEGTPILFPDPILSTGQEFVYRHSISGTQNFEYFSVRETQNQNDYQMHWVEEGLEGLRWPYRYVRYKMIWPGAMEKYSHYLRPLVSSEDQARATAVALPSENAPTIAYQDPLDQPRGKLTENFSYYSFLTEKYPAHRALLQFISGESVRFERVFSWLDSSLRNIQPLPPITFATDFSAASTGTSLLGTAQIKDGFLHLTDAVNFQRGAYIIDEFTYAMGEVVEGFKVNYTVSMRDSTCCGDQPGDGMSFQFGTIPEGIPSTPEEGISDGISVTFDLWDNGFQHGYHDSAPGITIHVNGQWIASVEMDEPNFTGYPAGTLPNPIDPATGQLMKLSTGPQFVPVEIILYPGGKMDVSFKGVKVLENIETGFQPRSGNFSFMARTAGATSTHWVDDLTIEILENGKHYNGLQFVGTVASKLDSWVANNGVFGFYWPDELITPRFVRENIDVGQAILPPDGELGSGEGDSYLAGFIQTSQGNYYHPQAYKDPFIQGFEAANEGVILPVNAPPGKNQMEVWWFRRSLAAGSPELTQGFREVFWPSVLGSYTLQWPENAREIVLASNEGSGPLNSQEAAGSIYFQNDSTQPGYNPNEEHALMSGGQAFALRDDLNVLTNVQGEYSSDPFVLLDFKNAEGKTALSLFRVRREKPEEGIHFDYSKTAGTILQAPMPLPLLGAAFAPKLPGLPRKALNEEVESLEVKSSGPSFPRPFWELSTEEGHGFRPMDILAMENPQVSPPDRKWFFVSVVIDGRTVGGVVSPIYPIRLGAGVPVEGKPNTLRFTTNRRSELVQARAAVAIVSLEDSWDAFITLPEDEPDKVDVFIFPSIPFPQETQEVLLIPSIPIFSEGGPSEVNDYRLSWAAPLAVDSPSEIEKRYSFATLTDRKGGLWIYRGPHDPLVRETFAMRYYYHTRDGFFFPTLALSDQPPVGTVTPYLRAKGPGGIYVGDPVYGNKDNGQEADHNSLPITYHPSWPDQVPVLQRAETLLKPKRGLPAVRGQNSLEVVYQQAVAGLNSDYQLVLNTNRTSVVLHDPTREKMVEFSIDSIPSSVNTTLSLGKTYFPNLPPHLVERFFLDPNRGENGMLVFKGEFVDAPLGEVYVLLNVAGTKDRQTLKDLCPPSAQDHKKADWDKAIDALSSTLEKYVENPSKPGTFIPSSTETFTAGIGDISVAFDEDVAVDSYALTAAGNHPGYVTLIAGNGEYLPEEGDPVDIQILRVAPELYRGEVAVVESDNPLSELLTLQQVVDLAGKTESYVFEWKRTPPVDGLPPSIYQKTPVHYPLMAGSWSHVRFPLSRDVIEAIDQTQDDRIAHDLTSDRVKPISSIPFQSVRADGSYFVFRFPTGFQHALAVGNELVMSSQDDVSVKVLVNKVSANPVEIVVSVIPNQLNQLTADKIFRLSEAFHVERAQSIVFTEFVIPPDHQVSELWLSLSQATGLGAEVFLNGGLVIRSGVPLQADEPIPQLPPSDLIASHLQRYYKLPGSHLTGGSKGGDGSITNRIAVKLYSDSLPDAAVEFSLRVEGYDDEDLVTQPGSVWVELHPEQFEDGVRAVLGGAVDGGADVESLSDSYLTMRYRPSDVTEGWSQWTEPQLAEGWIKRVLKGINPFNQRVTDLLNNAVNTDVSILTQAGQRWEGNVALNLEALNDYGLIEIYESVLNRGKNLSINAGINFGPANDALLLAAGYINDLYMMLGNEAASDAANPTIGIGTANKTYGDIATALFSFKGQLPTLLEEELAMLRGRDDFLVPGVETRPVYNRMVWNYTRGIDSGEVVYALNYNILDQNSDGKADAEDALILYPQGHGDAYGHYLTALKGYYNLLLNDHFDWVPRSEAVLILGKPVAVDYQDERKFAAAAGALARTGKQIFDLTWRRDYRSISQEGWKEFRSTRLSSKRERFWGTDHWASRTGQGAYLNWIIGNAMIPENDPNPNHDDTIQEIDRGTVLELRELPSVAEALQTALDNAEAGLTPLGLPENTIPFDLNPNAVLGGEGNTHFEQIYSRAKGALNNAVLAFDDAKDVTRLMRSEQDSLADFRSTVSRQELAYTNALIELYGTPYPEDIGPGKTYTTGYQGPDTIHYMYIDNVELNFKGPQGSLLDPTSDTTWKIDTQTFTANWLDENGISDFNFIQLARNGNVDGTPALEAWSTNSTLYVEYNLASHGFFKKPENWVGKRYAPGKIQQAISDIVKARNAAYSAFYDADAVKYDLDWAILALQRKAQSHQHIRDLKGTLLGIEQVEQAAKLAFEIYDAVTESEVINEKELTAAVLEGIPRNLIIGLSSGGDLTSAARAALRSSSGVKFFVLDKLKVARFSILKALEYGNQLQKSLVEFNEIETEEWNQSLREAMDGMRDKVYAMNNRFMTINQRLQELDDAHRKYQGLLAEGDRIAQEREIFRERTSAIIQGYRTRDAAFRIFRNEKLERFKTLFDLAAQYAFMAAKAYDYETGLLGTPRGREFIARIINARALGVMKSGEPQFAGSNSGDPGLSSVLAEMHADWSVLKSRLGFNNPDAYGTTFSLRYENFRVITNEVTWKNIMNLARKDNLLDDSDVRRYCLQLDNGSGLPVPGLIFEFSTTIADGLNFFGHPLAQGDHKFSVTSFATKVHSIGVAFEGYVGMDNPSANVGAVNGSGGISPPDPSLIFLNPDALSATPYVYLIPVGVDSMRSPPLGDQNDVRTWTVDDVAIPLPFNLGGSEFSGVDLWHSADSLSEVPFLIRKHQAFRPVSSTSVFGTGIYTGSGGLQRSQFTNNRLIGRSVWNSKWKLVVPGHELLSNPNEGLERFIRTVKDVKIHFVTYSYSGN